ncbi:MAG: hypothetical protein JNL05_00450 [Flavobacteriales bacterium]|nr:hypothetical protein [Flavobacteriales bacterium]
MIDLRVNGRSLKLQPGTTVPMELLNSALAGGLEDSFSLPFDVPIEGNEDVLGHAHMLEHAARTTSWRGAELWANGQPKHRGVLYLENVEDGLLQLSFSVDGFVAQLGDDTLKDVDYGGRINVSDETNKLVDWAKARNQEAYPTASHCFPMHFNPELQAGDNPSWYPDHQAWRSNQSYTINDLVSFEEGSPVRRAVNYQCVGNTSPGESPATTPAKWRRTAFGVVNHWDHASATFFENNPTDGNQYALVPFFYLKWVLAKAYARLGYTLQGDFMADARTHQLALYNNTSLDDGSRAGYLCVTHSTAVSMPANNGVLPSDTESGSGYADPNSLWNNSTYRFTCDAAGRRVFDIAFNITPAQPGWYRFVIRDAVTQAVLTSVQDTTIGTPLTGTARLVVDFVSGHVGTDWELVLEVWRNVSANGGIFPAKQTSTLNSVTITSWRYDSTNLLNAMALVIDPQDHVPDQRLAEFILDVCDLFTLERRYDHGARVAYLNYRKHVLSDAPADATAAVRSTPKLRLQELPTGYRFKHPDFDDRAEDLSGRTREADVPTEQDLTTPPSTRCYVVVRNSRRVYVSKHGADGNLYWWPAGWYLPPVTVGSTEEPSEVAPNWGPMRMEVITSNGEPFLVPMIEEAGNSPVFSTTGNAPSLRLVMYHGVVDNRNSVQYPFASSWGLDDRANDAGDMTLEWSGERGLLPLYAGSYFDRLAKAEVVELDLAATDVVLAAVENAPLLVMHQRCLVERLPLTYGDGQAPPVAAGARLYRLPPA